MPFSSTLHVATYVVCAVSKQEPSILRLSGESGRLETSALGQVSVRAIPSSFGSLDDLVEIA
ncbi:hypothetical protein T265_09912 [Opisthorchis viverrini]|uniref:Uncharacterized protein n=1 Tax=Opisthorchis viverrini TaxID=6198 RepID=A0A074Z468_OPIVI|nr:hypothetical protein T265_09912 [Opisthorchis viverrini]KER21848.1 hypothetical protein T265_09912 [Opisthorchis viverrini]